MPPKRKRSLSTSKTRSGSRPISSSFPSPSPTSTTTRRIRQKNSGASPLKPPLNFSLLDLICNLNAFSKSNARCSFALQALLDGGREVNNTSNATSTPQNTKESKESKEMTAEIESAVKSPKCSEHNSCFHEHSDANLIFVTTFTINNLIAALRKRSEDNLSMGHVQKKKKNEKSDLIASNEVIDIAAVLSSLCFFLGKIILSDRPRLERCATNAGINSNSSSPIDCSRGVVGRAIVSITLGSTLAIQALTSPFPLKELSTLKSKESNDKISSPNDLVLRRDGLWCSVSALEMIVHLSHKPNIPSMQFWGSSLPFPEKQIISSEFFMKACEKTENSLDESLKNYLECALGSFIQKQETQQISINAEDESLSSTASNKNKRQRRSKSIRSSVDAEVATRVASDNNIKHLGPESLISFDGRISVRRWGSTAFVWLCRGQHIVLEAAVTILSDNKWTPILQLPSSPISKHSLVQSIKRSTSQRRTRQNTQHKNLSNFQIENKDASMTGCSVPGNVARVALASRLIDLVDETSTSCGVRAPSGGIDVYAGIVLGLIPPPSPLRSITESKNKDEIRLSKSSKNSPRTGRIRRSTNTSANESTLASSVKWFRPDIRSISSVVVRSLIDAHSQCLSENFLESNILLNQEGMPGNESSSNKTIQYYTDIPRVLDILTRSAASSVHNSAFADASSDGIARLTAISCACILSNIENGKNLDAKLIGLVIMKLEATISGLFTAFNSEANSSETRDASKILEGIDDNVLDLFLKKTNLSHPIQPLYNGSSEFQEKKSNSSDFCSFGGIFSHDDQKNSHGSLSPFKHEEVLVLFLRAMHPFSCSSTSKKKKSIVVLRNLISEFLSKIIYTLKLCYASNEKSSVSRSTRIALATDIVNVLIKCLQKRTKTETPNIEAFQLMESVRKSLCLNHIKDIIHLQPIFEKTLIHPHLVESSSDLASNKETFGEEVSTSFCAKKKEFTLPERQLWTAHIDLCLTIGRGQAAYIENQHESVLSDSILRLNIFKEIAAFCSSSKNSTNSPHLEWPLSLSSLHHALVLSNLTSEPNPKNCSQAAPELFLCNSIATSIKNVFIHNQSFISNSPTHTTVISKEKPLEEYIPLSHRDARLFVIAVGRIPRTEQFQFVSRFFGDLKVILVDQEKDTFGDYEVSTFLGRLVTVLATLIDIVNIGKPLIDNFNRLTGPTKYNLPNLSDTFKLIESDDTVHDDCSWYTRERCFLGLTLDWESPNVPLVNEPILSDSLPSKDITNVMSVINTALQAGFESARIDHCHLLYSAWNASIKTRAWSHDKFSKFPCIRIQSDIDNDAEFLMLLREDICDIHKLLNNQSTQRTDTVLSWVLKTKHKNNQLECPTGDFLRNGLTNALAILDSLLTKISSSSNSYNIPVSRFTVMEGLAIYICFFISNHTVQENDFFTLYSRERKSKSSGRQSIRKNSTNSGESMDDEAMMDEEDGNVMSDESGDSDAGYPDFEEEDEEEAKLDALGGLHDACNTIGAAPIHPDWLDLSCHLRKGVDNSTALASSEATLRVLTELTQVAYSNYKNVLKDALLTNGCSGSEEKEQMQDMRRNAELSISILSCFSREDKNDFTPIDCDNDSLIAKVSSLCNVDNDTLSKVSDGPNPEKVQSVREAWCPNTTHCIRGKLQDPSPDGWEVTSGEQRAAGEWELLLADTFLGSCFGSEFITGEENEHITEDKTVTDSVPSPPRKKEMNQNQMRQKCSSARNSFVKAEQWAHVLRTAVSCMVPATALLRFTMNNGKGQSCHPLSKRERIGSEPLLALTPFSAVNVHESSILYNDNTFRARANSTVSKTLALLTHIASDGIVSSEIHNICQAAATHLVNDPATILNLVGSHRLQTCEYALSLMITATYQNEDFISRQMGAFNAVAHKLIECIESCSDETIFKSVGNLPLNCSDLENKVTKQSMAKTHPVKRNRFRRLLSHLGFSGIVKIEHILDPSGNLCLKAMKSFELSQSSDERSNMIFILVDLLKHRKCSLEPKTRLKIMSLIDTLLATERECSISKGGNDPVTSLILSSWNKMDSKDIVGFVRKDLCMLDLTNLDFRLSLHLCSIMHHMLRSLNPDSGDVETESVYGVRLVLFTLLDTIEEWTGEHSSPYIHIMDLLCLLATRFNQLKQTGKRLLALVTTAVDNMGKIEVGNRLTSLEIFYKFIRDAMEGVEYLKSQSNRGVGVESDTKAFKFLKCSHSSTVSAKSSALMQSSDTIRDETGETINSEKKSPSSSFLTKSGKQVLRTCSYVETGGEFTEQHWYICYTCGLLWDKGCCSLCAQVCHQGHDVGYSRQSSFFCDCGAEVSNTNDPDLKVSCKCLKPLSSNQLASIYNDKGKDSDSNTHSKDNPSDKGEVTSLKGSILDSTSRQRKKVILEALHSFPSVTESSISSFIEVLRVTGWTESLFLQFNRCFEEWAKKKKMSLSYSFSFATSSDVDDSSQNKSSNKATRSQTLPGQRCIRDGKPLTITPIEKSVLVPLRAAKASSVNIKLSLDTVNDRAKKSNVEKSDIHRCAMVSDSRGRLIIAEPYSLVFCYALPIINVRHSGKAAETPLNRSQLCINGTAKMKMVIVGMQLCPANERHLVVWGTSEASIVILSKSHEAIEYTINLTIELEPHECDTEYLLKCEWVPGSETLVLAVCGTFIKVFDIRRSTSIGSEKNYSCRSTTCYTMGYEDVLIRSATMVGDNHEIYNIEKMKQMISSINDIEPRNFNLVEMCDDEPNSSIIQKNREYAVQLVLLLDTGRINVTELRIDENGDLEDQGESYIECGDGLRFPIAGVRKHFGAIPSTQGTTSTHFGEGSSLHYLCQSQLLLYKCISAPLIAMKLDKSGNVVGSFEFLPHLITTEMLGLTSDGQSISAPYSHWTELGTTFHDGELIYRVSCVGKSTRTHLPKLLLIEFSETTVHVKDLALESSYDLNSSIDGLVSFSAPFLNGKGCRTGSLAKEGYFLERFFIASVHTNGSIFFFAEGTDSYTKDLHSKNDDSINNPMMVFPFSNFSIEKSEKEPTVQSEIVLNDMNHNEPTFPLTIFESLINLSESEDLILGGDGIANETNPRAAREKLKISNGDFISCPSRQGCTFTFAMRSNKWNIEREKHVDKNDCDEKNLYRSHHLSTVVIVAVRIQVGSSSTEYLPSHLNVMGRTIPVLRGMKRWYDVHLTDEEIMLGIRCGCVCVGIGESFDSSNCPIIDAIEVYGKQRGEIEFLNRLAIQNKDSEMDKFTTFSRPEHNWYRDYHTDARQSEKEGHKKALISSILCVTHVCRILKEQVDLPHVNRRIIRQLVQMTALDSGKGEVRDYVLDLLKEVEPNSHARQVLMDEGTLLGVGEELANLLKMCEDFVVVNPTLQELDQTPNSKFHSYSETVTFSNDDRSKALRNLIKCLNSSITIVNQRPSNYRNAVKKMISTGKLKNSVAIEAKVVFDALTQNTKAHSVSIKKWLKDPTDAGIGFSPSRKADPFGSYEAASLLTELSLLEMAIAGQEVKDDLTLDKKICSFANFDIIGGLLKSEDSNLVQCCCTKIAKVLEDSESNLQLPTSHNKNLLRQMGKVGQNPFGPGESSSVSKGQSPIAYQCDSCELFPITSVRYTLEGEDIDLCKKCYDSGCAFANASESTQDDPVKINSAHIRLGRNTELTCSKIRQMRSIAVESAIVEQVRIAALANSVPSTTQVTNPDSLLNQAKVSPEDDENDLKSALKMNIELNASEANHRGVYEEFHTGLRPLSEFLQQDTLFDLLLDESVRMTFSQIEFSFKDNDARSIEKPTCFSVGVNHLHQLLLFLILNAGSFESRTVRGKKFAEKMALSLSTLVDTYLSEKSGEEMYHQARISMIIVLKSLARLRLNKDYPSIPSSDEYDLDASHSGSKNKDKIDLRFVCDVHGVPAVRRRFSHGIHKDRRFYLCGKERNARCKYFKWADDDDNKSVTSSTASNHGSRATSQTKSGPCNIMQTELLKLFSQSGPNNSAPLQAKLCDLMQACYRFSDANSDTYTTRDSLNSKAPLEEDKSFNRRVSQSSSPQLESLLTEGTIMEDWFDGVMLSRNKVGPYAHGLTRAPMDRDFIKKPGTTLGLTSEESSSFLVQASLCLLSHLATNSLQLVSTKHVSMTSTWSSGWFSLLCEILSTSSKTWSHQRVQAKNMLKKLCGGRRETYHRVRDHYVFAFQFKKLLRYCEDLLLSALEVKEKARQCGPNWNKARELSWGSISPGGLFGLDGLITEDSLTVQNEERVRVVLEEFIEVTKNRGGNWRKFCAMTELPLTKLSDKMGSSKENDITIYNRPPIYSLLWMACSLSGSNQLKILRLIEVALTDSKDVIDMSLKQKTEKEDRLLNDHDSMETELRGMEQEKGNEQAYFHSSVCLQGESGTPEHVLLDKKIGLNIEDIYTFVIQFVLRGKSLELRNISSLVADKIFHHVSDPDMNTLLLRFVSEPLFEVGSLGCGCLEFLKLMQNVITSFGSNTMMKLELVADFIATCFVEQMQAQSTNLYDKCVESKQESDSQELHASKPLQFFDLGSCVHCHRQRAGEPETINPETSSIHSSRPRNLSRSSVKYGSTASSTCNGETGKRPFTTDKKESKQRKETTWLLQQFRPYTRNRLDSSSDKVVSTEFATHVQLKYRLAISDVHVAVSDPRGRLVKTIAVFFSPRQVGKVTELKKEEYSNIWQQCGTLSLARGSLRASCSLSPPVVAANLKFEYQEFYEKVGGARSSDGRMLLTCPRCTRVVNNNHGVCGHCGEVAFQCRKCRHINYDRLDAFLCVECGYCASGGFVYELTAGNASNAVAIINEEGFERSMKFLQLASRRLGDTRNSLRAKILALTTGNRKRTYCGDPKDFDRLNKYGPALKRAVLGEMPKFSGKDAGNQSSDSVSRRRSAAAIVASRRGDPSSAMSAANKARSLLSLARQLRSESIECGLEGERSGRGENLVRQALLNVGGSGGSIEFFDDSGVFGDDGDVFGIINGSRGSSMLQGDMTDPLSRLVANIQARVRSSAMTSIGGGIDEPSSETKLTGGGGDGVNNGGGSSSNKKSPQEQNEECKRLHQNMRDAERECHELRKNIDAWKRLNRGELVQFSPNRSSSFNSLNFVPSYCTRCADSVALHILELLMSILTLERQDFEIPVSRNLVLSLMKEPQGLSEDLQMLKRLAVVALVERSSQGATQVLDELKRRLRATRDVASAELLGSILDKDFKIIDKYTELAMEVLSHVD